MKQRTKKLKILSLGAGVQSSTLLLLAHEGVLPKPDYAVFADTGFEPHAVYAWLKYLKRIVTDIPIETVSNGSLHQDLLGYMEGRVPVFRKNPPFFTLSPDGKKGMMKRQCTTEYKIIPIRRFIRDVMRQRGFNVHDTQVEQWLGISVDEMQRAACSDVQYILNRFPLLELRMTRQDCLKWLRSHGYKKPSKSGCVICPYNSHKIYENMRDKRPNEWVEATWFDTRIRHLFPHMDTELFISGDLKPLYASLMNTEEQDSSDDYCAHCFT